MNVKIYVEGGGDHNKALQTQCRRGFSEFFRKAGLEGRMPRIVACGGRGRAYDSFCTSHENARSDYLPILLVDSEATVTKADPWEHVRLRTGDWLATPPRRFAGSASPHGPGDGGMVHADKEKVQAYFGQCFRLPALSQRLDIDNIPKLDLFAGMLSATRACPAKGEYSKGKHSFEILALIDPAKVRASSPVHAGRLLNLLDQICTP